MVTAKASAARVSLENTIPVIPLVGRVQENAAGTSATHKSVVKSHKQTAERVESMQGNHENQKQTLHL